MVYEDGRFLSVPTVDFASARVRRRAAGTQRRDDDLFDLTPSQVVGLITGVPDIGDRGGRSFGATVVFDVAELYDVLSARLEDDRDANGNGHDDLDELFVAHGFHENLGSPRPDRYTRGARIGVTTHAPHDRAHPRHSAEIAADLWVTIDTGGVAATMTVFSTAGMPYQVEPDANGRIPVLVPSAETKGRAVVVTQAEGYRPHVTVIESKSFWQQAAGHDEPFLTVPAALEREGASAQSSAAPAGGVGPVQAAGARAESTAVALPVAAGVTVLFLAVGALLIRRSRRARTG